MIKAKIVADSINEFDDRITTFECTFPRIILAEVNTHRMFSRNSASSRAIPFKRMVEMVQENPFIPLAFQKDHKGMQGNKYIQNSVSLSIRKKQWLEARDKAVESAIQLHTPLSELYKEHSEYENYIWEDEEPVTKQLCNRILEPFMWHTALITSTEVENFFHLRSPQYGGHHPRLGESYYRSKKDTIKALKRVDVNTDNLNVDIVSAIEWLKINQGGAEIHMMSLTESMWDVYNESTPIQLNAGKWHIPYGDNIDTNIFLTEQITVPHDHLEQDFENLKIKIATARCARLSYQTLGDNPRVNYKSDIELHNRLASMGHWSPFEHCARAMTDIEYNENRKGCLNNNWALLSHDTAGWSGNFKGFIQYRKMFQDENKN
jgi:thymidylate synthase ThyX